LRNFEHIYVNIKLSQKGMRCLEKVKYKFITKKEMKAKVSTKKIYTSLEKR